LKTILHSKHFHLGDLVIDEEYPNTMFEIEAISLSGKYYLKNPGEENTRYRHAHIPQPVDKKLLRKAEIKAL
jgi:hypothetical protein